MKCRFITMLILSCALMCGMAFADPDPAFADQVAIHQTNDGWEKISTADITAVQQTMATQARLTASIADPHQQVLHLSDGSVLTLYRHKVECRQTMMGNPHQKVAWHPC